jgi:four helix bundle protein
MGIKRLEDLVAFQLAVQLKRGVYALVDGNTRARSDWKYRDQLFDAALGGESNIAEGWYRYNAAEISQFIRYALASLAETDRRLRDGADRKYFTQSEIEPLCRTCSRAIGATTNWWKSLQPFIKKKRPGRPNRDFPDRSP